MSKSLGEIHDYWKHVSKSDYYIDKVGRSELLLEYIQKYSENRHRILELGCNVGRNLNHLMKNHYRNLTGIEISEEAVNSLKKNFPTLYENATIIHSPIENIIKEIPNNQYHVVFTMAVLEHIHPESEWIFKEMARVTKSYLITIEAETAKNWRLFPRNYKVIFENLGMKQIEANTGEKELGLGAYTIRVFKKQKGLTKFFSKMFQRN